MATGITARAPAKADVASTKSSVLSLVKAFRLLEAIAASENDLTLSELAVASGLDPGTTHRMLKTLIDLGYVDRSEGKRFALTLKVLDLGFRAIGRRDIRALARPLLRSLVDEVREAASLGVLSGSDVLYVERMRAGVIRLGVDIRVGTLVPAVDNIIGWAILAFLPDREKERLLAEPSPQREVLGEAPPDDLRKQLQIVRDQGYALGPSMISGGLIVLAVPVLDLDGYPIAGISVAAPNIRMSLDVLRERALDPLLQAAEIIAKGLEANGGAVAG